MRSRKVRLKDNSTLDKAEYIVGHFLYGTLSSFSYYVYYRIIWKGEASQSFLDLLLCVFLTSLAGICITYWKERTITRFLLNIVAGWGIFMLKIRWKSYRHWIQWILIAAICITLYKLLIIWMKKSSRKYGLWIVFQNKVSHTSQPVTIKKPQQINSLL